MKALIYQKFNNLESISIQEVAKPIIGPRDLLIRVHYSTIQSADWRIRTQNMPKGMEVLSKFIFGFSKPKQPILGTELAGIVEEVGSQVYDFKNGDAVVAVTGVQMGAHAEYVKLSQKSVIMLNPPNLALKEAVAFPFGGLTALDFLKYRARLKENEKVLIIGASGSVGVAAIQIAQALGAQVTAVCSPKNFDKVQQLGAIRVLDYHKQDFLKDEFQYDVIFSAVEGYSSHILKGKLTSKGRLVLIAAGFGEMIKSIFPNSKTHTGVVPESKERLTELFQMVQKKQLRSVIDKVFPLNQGREAHQYVENKNKCGNVLLEIGSS